MLAGPTRRTLESSAATAAGLLMGVALTQHPEDYRAVVSLVGYYDALRLEVYPNGEYGTHEFGTVTNAGRVRMAQRLLAPAACASRHRLPGRAAHHRRERSTRRAVAVAQVCRGAAEGQRLAPAILLITRRGEGHGVYSSFSQRVGNTGAELSFFAEELGLAPAAPPTSPSNKTSP